MYEDTGFDIFSVFQLLWRALAQGYLKLWNLHLKTPPPRKSTKQKSPTQMPALGSSLLFSVHLFSWFQKLGGIIVQVVAD